MAGTKGCCLAGRTIRRTIEWSSPRRSKRWRRYVGRAGVRLSTDSTYVKNGITQWIERWKRRNWKTVNGKPVKNVDLWRRLDRAASRHRIEWMWVRGHAGHEDNERADALARSAIEERLS